MGQNVLLINGLKTNDFSVLNTLKICRMRMPFNVSRGFGYGYEAVRIRVNVRLQDKMPTTGSCKIGLLFMAVQNETGGP
jgi:hypothetical protein